MTNIENIGPVPVNQGAKLYQESDICFVPSILETFSATYLEADVNEDADRGLRLGLRKRDLW